MINQACHYIMILCWVWTISIHSVSLAFDKTNNSSNADVQIEYNFKLNETSCTEIINPESPVFSAYKGEAIPLKQFVWFKLTFDNSQLSETTNYIHFYELFSKVELFQVRDGDTAHFAIAGYYIPANKRTFLHIHNDLLPFKTFEGQSTSFYIKGYAGHIESNSRFNFQILPEHKVHQTQNRNYIFQSFFLGFILVICFINLMQFYFSRDKLYLVYVSHTVVIAIFFLAYTQVLDHTILSNLPVLDRYLFFMLYPGMVLYALFVFLAIKNDRLTRWSSLLKKYIKFLVISCPVIIAISFFRFPLAIEIGHYYTLFNGVFLMVAIWMMFSKVSKMVKVIIIGSQFIVLGGGMSKVADMIQYMPQNVFYYQTGFIIELLFFSVAVNFMHYRNRMEKIKIQQKNLELENDKLKKEKELAVLKHEVDDKNRLLANKVIVISQKEELIKKVIGQLSNQAVNGSSKENISLIVSELKSSIHNNNWKEFEVHFTKVHPLFYKKLEQSYPDLSSNERKLCAFLKLNLSTKEISEISGKSLNTIDVARSRLRKKMKLHSSANITTIISGIG